MSQNAVSVKLNKAQTVDEIYEQVKDFDLILSVDAPLSDALCVRSGLPRLGYFATTPRRWALGQFHGEKMENKRALFLKIVDATDMNWKFATYLMENLVSCWRETGDPRNILSYSEFAGPETEEMIGIMTETHNQYSAMMKTKIPPDTKVAVVGEEQFRELDRLILPDDYERVELLRDETHELPPFRVFGTSSGVVSAVMSDLTKCSPTDVAIVVEEGSSYGYSVESALRARDIPCMRPRGLAEDEDLRTFLKLARLSGARGILIKEIVPILLHLGRRVGRRYRSLYLDPLERGRLTEFRELLSNFDRRTFGDALEVFEGLVPGNLDEIEKNIRELGLYEQEMSKANLDRLEYYLNSFDLSVEEAGRGVLLASPKTSARIDRPVIYYLGMDASWSPAPDPRPWTDRRERGGRNLRDFQVLLQNGEKQYYMVRDRYMGERVIPCHYLSELATGSFECFTDLKHVRYRTSVSGSSRPFERTEPDVETEPVRTLSQSSLNILALCPKDYLFSRLVETEDKFYFRRGNLLHDFAEFYANHRDFVRDRGPDVFADMMREGMRPYVDELELPALRTAFLVGVRNIMGFLDRHKCTVPSLPGYEKRDRSNYFAERFGKPVVSQYTEMSFRNEMIGANGKVDLILCPDHIVDYKTGKKKSVARVIRDSDVNVIERRPDFQAKMYLSHLRHILPRRKLTFTFLHVLDNLDDVVEGGGDVDECAVNVVYYPEHFSNVVPGEEVFEGLKSSKNRKKVLDKLEYENYRKFFEEHPMPECDAGGPENTEIARQFEEFCVNKIADYKYVRRGSLYILKELANFRKKSYFVTDLTEFEEFLRRQIGLLNRYKTEGFPVGDADIDEIENKDLVITYG